VQNPSSSLLKNRTDYQADTSLTSKYPTYEDYITDNAMAWPSHWGNQWTYHGLSYDWSTKWANWKFKKLDGTVSPVYGVVNYAKYPDGETGVVSAALNWRMMGVDDGFELLKDVPTSGWIVSDTLVKLGGTNTGIGNTSSYWIIGGTTLESWCYYGPYGMFDHNQSTTIECISLPVADYDIIYQQ
jgi:hypothetical protein